MKKDKDKNRGKTIRYLSLVTQLGISSAIPIIFGVLLGNFIDQKAGTNGLFAVLLLIVGGLTAINNIIRMAKPREKEQDDE